MLRARQEELIMAVKQQYQLVGRYMDESRVVGYHLQDLTTGKSGRFDRETMCFLVGRGSVTNVKGRIYQGKVLFEGVGMEIKDLPVVNEGTNQLRRGQNIRNVKGQGVQDKLEQLMIVGVLKSGRTPVAYVLRNQGGGTKQVSRDEIIALAKVGKISNVRVQQWNGKILLRGYNCDLSMLPQQQIDQG